MLADSTPEETADGCVDVYKRQAEPAALIERNRAIAEAFTVGKDTAPHIRRYYDDLTEQTAKELVV